MLTVNLSTAVQTLQGCPDLYFHQQNRGTFEVAETNTAHYPV